MYALLFAQALAVPASTPSDLVELARIVEPYARCEISRASAFERLRDEWSVTTKKSYAMPKDEAASKESARLMEQLRLAEQQTRTVCGHEQVHQQLRDRLKALHPKMDDARAFWLARSVFSNLNNLNETVVKFSAGDFPKPPVAPFSPRQNVENAPNQ